MKRCVTLPRMHQSYERMTSQLRDVDRASFDRSQQADIPPLSPAAPTRGVLYLQPRCACVSVCTNPRGQDGCVGCCSPDTAPPVYFSPDPVLEGSHPCHPIDLLQQPHGSQGL